MIFAEDREPLKLSVVYSDHLKDGIKSNLPTIFQRNLAKRFFPRKTSANKYKIQILFINSTALDLRISERKNYSYSVADQQQQPEVQT